MILLHPYVAAFLEHGLKALPEFRVASVQPGGGKIPGGSGTSYPQPVL
jgi:hypothetical protein